MIKSTKPSWTAFRASRSTAAAPAGVLTAMDGLPGVDGGLTTRFHDPIETLNRIGDVAVMRDSTS